MQPRPVLNGLVLRLLVCAAVGLGAGSLGAQEFPQPTGPVADRGFRPIGDPIKVEVTDYVNPVYLKIHFTAAELRNVDSIGIFDHTARRELHRFRRGEFGSQIQGASDTTTVTFGKNLTFRRPEKRSRRLIMVTAFNERGRPIRSSAYEINVEPHPSETIAAENSYQVFYDIAQIDFREACRGARERFGLQAGIFIGEAEQEFPSLAYLTGVQNRESLRGYFEGCVAAYTQCLGGGGGKGQDVQGFCTEQREKLRRDVFSGQGQ